VPRFVAGNTRGQRVLSTIAGTTTNTLHVLPRCDAERNWPPNPPLLNSDVYLVFPFSSRQQPTVVVDRRSGMYVKVPLVINIRLPFSQA
jgi:hypothetical protein